MDNELLNILISFILYLAIHSNWLGWHELDVELDTLRLNFELSSLLSGIYGRFQIWNCYFQSNYAPFLALIDQE